jgi:hypothetical protein
MGYYNGDGGEETGLALLLFCFYFSASRARSLVVRRHVDAVMRDVGNSPTNRRRDNLFERHLRLRDPRLRVSNST